MNCKTMNEYRFRKHLLDESVEADSRKIKLEHQIDEKFVEIYFLIKEEYDIKGNSKEERELYTMLQDLHTKLKDHCEESNL